MSHKEQRMNECNCYPWQPTNKECEDRMSDNKDKIKEMKLEEALTYRCIFKRKNYEVYLAQHPLRGQEIYAKRKPNHEEVTFLWTPSLEDILAEDYQIVNVKGDLFWNSQEKIDNYKRLKNDN